MVIVIQKYFKSSSYTYIINNFIINKYILLGKPAFFNLKLCIRYRYYVRNTLPRNFYLIGQRLKVL